MNIVLLIKELPLGGAEKQCLLLAKILQDNYNVILVLQNEEPFEQRYYEFLMRHNIRFQILGGNLIQKISRLRKLLLKEQANLLLSYLTMDNFIAAFGTLFLKIPVVAGIRNCKLPFSKFLTNLLLQFMFYDKVLFNNYSGMNSLIKMGFLKSKAITVHNCLENISPFIKREDNDSLMIITVGRFVVQKDYFTALKAIAYLKNHLDVQKKFVYKIIGFGEMEQAIKNKVKSLKLDNVQVIVSPENIDFFYKNADILLCTSTYEGMPNVVMEGCNFSLPVVSTIVGDVDYLITQGKTGYLHKVKDYKGLACSMQRLINDYEMRIDFGKHGYDNLVQHFSKQKFKYRYEKLINKIAISNVTKKTSDFQSVANK